jgi:hypothetical protein
MGGCGRISFAWSHNRRRRGDWSLLGGDKIHAGMDDLRWQSMPADQTARCETGRVNSAEAQ